MGANPLREVLNRLRWAPDAARTGAVLDVWRREGARGRLDAVGFDAVVAILPGGVTMADGTFIPYHRIVAVRREHEVLWGSERRESVEA